MDRRETLKALLLGTASFSLLPSGASSAQVVPEGLLQAPEPMRSDWTGWPDMTWAGPAFWGNRLQDWRVAGGMLECAIRAPNRSLHCLTHQLAETRGDVSMGVTLERLNPTGSADDQIGFCIGARAQDQPVRVPFDDYRRNAVFGEGLHAGIDGTGRLFIGDRTAEAPLPSDQPVRLTLAGREAGGPYQLTLEATDVSSGAPLARLEADDVDADRLVGSLALLAHISSQEESSQDAAAAPSARFSDWHIAGSKLTHWPGQTYGPICFAQYTLDRGVLKMTAQLAPVETIDGHRVELQLREGSDWLTVEQTTVNPLARTAHFRIDDWSRREAVPYRIRLTLPLETGPEEFIYEGTIAAEPAPTDPLKMAVFSCNSHYGFPNSEVVRNASAHRPDLAVFLGDQIYESHGGFGVERTHDVEKATLDYLRKWYMFGWSYRDLFRHIPSAFIPDDHDVFHGNIWGAGGKDAPTDAGWGYDAQDQGGYKYPPAWVRMVERTLTSHLPDPWDPTPIEQGIGVYYTDWTYGGVSLAILEDRKFKTAPNGALPFEVVNGFPQDPDIDLRAHYDIDAELLGARQEDFLAVWVADWSGGARMKAVLSQSPFCGAHTMEQGATTDQGVPELPIPQRGKYPSGDNPARDMDTNGWPPKARDEALRVLRKGFALHVAGDQHLGSVIRYGVEQHGDAGFVFTGPALNNIWPRRWWPAVEADHQPLMGRPRYTGDFRDAFGNRMTVLTAANPVQTNREPALIYDRATGYGIVTFDPTGRTMHIECWPRYVDPQSNPGGQYDGWPVVINQQQNYGRAATGTLPELQVEGLEDPVVEVHDPQRDELVYALRINGHTFRPKVFGEGPYTVRVGEPDDDRWQEFVDLRVEDEGPLRCTFD